MKVLVGTFNKEKALEGAFSVIGCGTDGALHSTTIVRYIRCIQTTVSNKLTIVPAWNIKVAGGCGFLETRDNNGGLHCATFNLQTSSAVSECCQSASIRVE